MTTRSLKIVCDDITQIRVKAIANAANETLMPGGGIDGAIRRAAGRKLTEETNAIRMTLPGNKLKPGDVVCTDSYNIGTCEKILHTAGPNLQAKLQAKKKHNRVDEHHLRMCYLNILRVCDDEGISSVAIPFLSIGIFGYPEEEGMRVALQSVFAYFETRQNSQIDEISFVTNNQRIYDYCLKKILKKTDPEITFSDAECSQLRLTIETINEKDKTKPLPTNQQKVMPVNNLLKIGSFVKKWNNNNEMDDVKGMVVGEDVGRQQRAEYMRLYRERNENQSQNEAEERRLRRLKEGDEGRRQDAQRKQEVRRDAPKLAEKEAADKRKRREVEGEAGRRRNAQRMSRTRAADRTLVEKEIQKRTQRRQKPEIRARENLLRRVRTNVKANLFGAPAHVIKSGNVKVEVCQTGAKKFVIRERMSMGRKIGREFIGLFSKERREFYEKRFQKACSVKASVIQKKIAKTVKKRDERIMKKQCSDGILKKYGLKMRSLKVLSRTKVLQEYGKLLENQTNFDKKTEKKRTLLAADYFVSNGIVNPSYSDRQQAVMECNVLYFTGMALAEIAKKKVTSAKCRLIGFASARCNRNIPFKNGHEKAVYEMGGGHVHVKTHESSSTRNRGNYEAAEEFFPRFVSAMKEKGEMTPEKIGHPAESLRSPLKGTPLKEQSVEGIPPVMQIWDVTDSTPIKESHIDDSDSSEGSEESSVSEGSSMPEELDAAPPVAARDIIITAEDCQTQEDDSSVCEDDDEAEILNRLTLMRAGDEECSNEEVMQIDWPNRVREMLFGLDDCKTNKEMYEYMRKISTCKDCEEQYCSIWTCKNRLRLLRELEVHYKTIRLVLRTWYSLRQHLRWLVEYEEAEQRRMPSFKQFCDLVANDRLSSEMRAQKAKLALKKSEDSHHMESAVLAKYGRHIEKFRKALRDLETNKCECCFRLFKKKEICQIPCDDRKLPEFLRHPRGAPNVIICKECRRQMKPNGALPDLCIMNGLELDEIPDELKGLNWLELIFVKKIRPIMSTFQLVNARGRKHGTHRAYKGTVLHMPVPIEETLRRVKKKLPSTDGVLLKIQVESKDGFIREEFVNPDKIFKAVEWLQTENPFYGDIEIADRNEFEDELNASGIPQTTVQEGGSPQYLLTMSTVDTTVSAATRVNPQPPEGQSAEILMKLKKMKGEPVQSNAKHLEEQCFPEIFPKARGALHSARQKAISWTRYIHRNLRLSDRRFINDTYAIVMNNMQDIKTLLGSINVQSKKIMRGREFLEKMSKGELDTELSTMFRSLRSHSDYWKERRKDLKTIIKYKGPPTFFITVNPAENEWAELRATYEAVYKDKIGDNMTTSMFCVLDAMIFTRHFGQRTTALYKNLLMGAKGIFGHGIDYWRRTEYQMRGAPHCHGLIWIKDAPTLKKSSKEEVVNFIDKHITCRIPDPITEPNLYDLVRKFQQHICTATCKSEKKINGRRKVYCRFGYPFDAQSETVLTDKTGMFDDPLLRKKSYYLRRPMESAHINAYNPALILAWMGNIDVQFLGEMSLANLAYLTSYVGKGESKSKIDEDFAQFVTSMTDKDAIRLGMNFLRLRELGIPEVFDRLMSQHLYDSSCCVQFLNNNDKDSRMRMLQTISDLSEVSENGVMTKRNIYDDYYPNRPEILENHSLFTIFTALQYASKLPSKKADSKKKNEEDGEEEEEEHEEEDSECSGADNDEIAEEGLFEGVGYFFKNDPDSPFYMFPKGSTFKLNNVPGYFKARIKPILARFFLPDLSDTCEDPVEMESYYRRLLFMFKPWRDEDVDLMGDFETFAEAWIDFWENSPPVTKSGLQKILDRTQEMYEAAKTRREEEQKRREQLQNMEIEDVVNEIEVPVRTVSPETVEESIQRLNADQRRAFDDVVKAIEDRENGIVDIKQNFFISGFAGTGKSELIRVIADYVTLTYGDENIDQGEPSVLLAAPTGLAAVNIGGNTIHSLVKLEVEHGKMAAYAALNPQTRSALNILFRRVKVIIIDEISMVSNILLLKLCQRLQDIKGSENEPFGGYLLVVFGDLLQLPPVRLLSVFENVRGYQVRQIFHSMPFTMNLWASTFQYRELTINMRQREDLEYSDILNRARVGSLNDDDYAKILSRFITANGVWEKGMPLPRPSTLTEAVDYYLQLRATDSKAIAVFGYTRAVAAFNDAVLARNSGETVVIDSKDEAAARMHKKGTLRRPWLRKGMRRIDLLLRSPTKYRKATQVDDTKKAGGLARTLKLQVGCRIMLTRNVDTAMKLVNGALGELLEVRCVAGEPQKLLIKFDGIEEPQEIVRVRAVYNIGPQKQAARSQFPVVVAYATTIHKCQGMSVDNVLVDLYDLFAAGQGYVALSRSRTLMGLHVVNFHPDSIFASGRAIEEYNRLRDTIEMEPLEKPNITSTIKDSFPKKSKKWLDIFLEDKTLPTVPLVKQLKRKAPVRTKKAAQQKPKTTAPRKIATKKVRQQKEQAITIEEIQPLPNPTQLLLTNTANHCFANSAVQALRRMWCRQYSNLMGSSPLCDQLLLLIDTPGRKSVNNLLIETGVPEYQSGLQQDSWEFLGRLFESLPIEMTAELLMSSTKSNTCRTCGHVSYAPEVPENIITVEAVQRRMSFQDLVHNVRKEEIIEKECPNCDGVDTGAHRRHLQNKNIHRTPLNKYLVLTMPLFLHQGERQVRNQRAIPLPNANERLFESNWKLIAAIEHIGATPRQGHYKAWILDDQDWFIYNDVQVSPVRSHQDRRSRQGDFYYYVFEAIDE